MLVEYTAAELCGSVPVVITLARDEVATPEAPLPVALQVPRGSLLLSLAPHLQAAFGPHVVSFGENTLCYLRLFVDGSPEQTLLWQHPIGVIADVVAAAQHQQSFLLSQSSAPSSAAGNGSVLHARLHELRHLERTLGARLLQHGTQQTQLQSNVSAEKAHGPAAGMSGDGMSSLVLQLRSVRAALRRAPVAKAQRLPLRLTASFVSAADGRPVPRDAHALLVTKESMAAKEAGKLTVQLVKQATEVMLRDIRPVFRLGTTETDTVRLTPMIAKSSSTASAGIQRGHQAPLEGPLAEAIDSCAFVDHAAALARQSDIRRQLGRATAWPLSLHWVTGAAPAEGSPPPSSGADLSYVTTLHAVPAAGLASLGDTLGAASTTVLLETDRTLLHGIGFALAQSICRGDVGAAHLSPPGLAWPPPLLSIPPPSADGASTDTATRVSDTATVAVPAGLQWLQEYFLDLSTLAQLCPVENYCDESLAGRRAAAQGPAQAYHEAIYAAALAVVQRLTKSSVVAATSTGSRGSTTAAPLPPPTTTAACIADMATVEAFSAPMASYARHTGTAAAAANPFCPSLLQLSSDKVAEHLVRCLVLVEALAVQAWEESVADTAVTFACAQNSTPATSPTTEGEGGALPAPPPHVPLWAAVLAASSPPRPRTRQPLVVVQGIAPAAATPLQWLYENFSASDMRLHLTVNVAALTI